MPHADIFKFHPLFERHQDSFEESKTGEAFDVFIQYNLSSWAFPLAFSLFRATFPSLDDGKEYAYREYNITFLCFHITVAFGSRV